MSTKITLAYKKWLNKHREIKVMDDRYQAELHKKKEALNNQYGKLGYVGNKKITSSDPAR